MCKRNHVLRLGLGLDLGLGLVIAAASQPLKMLVISYVLNADRPIG